MKVSEDASEMANARAAARLRKTPCATKARYERKRGRVVIGLNTGIEVAFRPCDAQGLEGAKPDQLDTIEISRGTKPPLPVFTGGNLPEGGET